MHLRLLRILAAALREAPDPGPCSQNNSLWFLIPQ